MSGPNQNKPGGKSTARKAVSRINRRSAPKPEPLQSAKPGSSLQSSEAGAEVAETPSRSRCRADPAEPPQSKQPEPLRSQTAGAAAGQAAGAAAEPASQGRCRASSRNLTATEPLAEPLSGNKQPEPLPANASSRSRCKVQAARYKLQRPSSQSRCRASSQEPLQSKQPEPLQEQAAGAALQTKQPDSRSGARSRWRSAPPLRRQNCLLRSTFKRSATQPAATTPKSLLKTPKAFCGEALGRAVSSKKAD